VLPTIALYVIGHSHRRFTMNASRENTEKTTEEPTAATEPLFRRYQVKIKAAVKVGYVPMGRPPIF
jgi:hypothetical protein